MRCRSAQFRQSVTSRLGSRALQMGFVAILFGGTITVGDDKPAESRTPQLSERARAIVDQLKPDVRTLAVYVTYVPKAREGRPNLELYGPQIVIHPGDDRFHITDEQCRKIFDWLVADGYFERTSELLAEKKVARGRRGRSTS